jgi:chromosome segregation ATPase
MTTEIAIHEFFSAFSMMRARAKYHNLDSESVGWRRLDESTNALERSDVEIQDLQALAKVLQGDTAKAEKKAEEAEALREEAQFAREKLRGEVEVLRREAEGYKVGRGQELEAVRKELRCALSSCEELREEAQRAKEALQRAQEGREQAQEALEEALGSARRGEGLALERVAQLEVSSTCLSISSILGQLVCQLGQLVCQSRAFGSFGLKIDKFERKAFGVSAHEFRV